MRRAKGRGKRADMGMLVAETATRLRSGATPEGAWRQTLERAGLGAHADLDADGVPAALRKLWLAPREEVRLGVPPAIAVCRMSKLTGAPTADVLESCAAGITEAGEAAAARRVAMAGPKASARILALLPVLGLCVGTMIGAEPLAFLLSPGPGRVLLALGFLFELAGLAWARALVRRAERG